MNIKGFVNQKLEAAGIPYEYGEWSSKATYPYFVGLYTETDYRFEDNYSAGIFNIDGWSRGNDADLVLTTMQETIKSVFQNLNEVVDNTLFFIRYGGVQPIQTDEAELSHIQITLYTYFWKGNEE
ncbi:MAG: hypothetical protein II816_03695 [Elusimicrobia bacterium]|nr:hypothetical protein [Elusimicrobiota bacterium]